MNKTYSRPKLPSAIHKVSEYDLADDCGNIVAARILQTREMRQLIGNVIPEMLCVLAGKSAVKRSLMKGVGKYLRKSLARPGDIFEEQELRLLFEEETFVQDVLKPLPGMINSFFDVISTLVGTIEGLETSEKKVLLSSLLSKIVDGQMSAVITRFARIYKDIHQDDPEFLVRTLGPGLAKLIDATDFGDLKVFLEGTFKDMTALGKVVNETIFDKPAKVVLLLTVFPMLVNMIAQMLEDTARRFNTFPPDLAADVILSIFREIDAKTVGILANEGMELFRKLNVGSALIGDPGTPQCRLDMAKFIEEFTAGIDLELLWKFREALAQTRERADLAMTAVMKKNPRRVVDHLKKAPALRNYRVKSANQKLGLIENLPAKAAMGALSEGVSKIDANLMAEWINLVTLLVNRLNDASPDVLPDLAGTLISTLDLGEIEDTAKWAAENLGGVLEPLGRILMPNLIKMAAGWLSANGDRNDEAVVHARETISRFVTYKEVEA